MNATFLSIPILTAVLLVACKPPAPVASAEVIRPVKTMTVGVTAAMSEQSYSAEIRPRIESQLGFRVGGKVTERLVEIGSIVHKDQPLMRLDPVDLQLSANAALAQVAAARANDDVAQATLRRTQDLAKQNFISQGALDQAVGAANASKAALAAALANSALGTNATQYGTLKADSDGVVTALNAEVGQVVAAGTPVIRLASGIEKDVVFAVPESVQAQLKAGASIDVQLWAQSGVALSAKVRDVSVMADSLTRTYTIKASLKNTTNTVPLGATATATMHFANAKKQATALAIPLASVIEAQGKTAVWVVQTEGKVSTTKKRVVSLAGTLPAAGATAGDEIQVAVAAGLVQGEQVVTAGVHTLTEGQKVRLLD